MNANETKTLTQAEKNELYRHAGGRVLGPMILWIAGVPFGLVLILWFFFFRGP